MSYNLYLRLVFINKIIKIIHYKIVKMIIDMMSQAKININMIIKYKQFLDIIVSNKNVQYISKFLLSLCYLLRIKQKRFIIFDFYINSHITSQNSIIKIHFQTFINKNKIT